MDKINAEATVDGMQQNIYTQIIGYLITNCYNGDATLDITEISNVKGSVFWIEKGQLRIRSY